MTIGDNKVLLTYLLGMVYIRFKTFQKYKLFIFLGNILSYFRAIIKYISYAAIMDTSPEMQIQLTVAFCIHGVNLMGAWPSPDMAAAS